MSEPIADKIAELLAQKQQIDLHNAHGGGIPMPYGDWTVDTLELLLQIASEQRKSK